METPPGGLKLASGSGLQQKRAFVFRLKGDGNLRGATLITGHSCDTVVLTWILSLPIVNAQKNKPQIIRRIISAWREKMRARNLVLVKLYAIRLRVPHPRGPNLVSGLGA